MKTLLVLGSKPKPELPSPTSYQDVACANGSGYSASLYGLPAPVFTVMTSVLASGIESGRQSLQALTGLSTGTLYFLRRRDQRRSTLGNLSRYIKTFRKKRVHRMQPFYLKRVLRSLNYSYGEMVVLKPDQYDKLVERLCDLDPGILKQLQRKRPSTGLIALALAIESKRYHRYIMSGFSFELTHPYALNPEIEQRGTAASGHADTDIMVIQYLSRKLGAISTTESSVHERAGVPFAEE